VSAVKVTKDDERYEALSQGFNQRWVASPDYIALASSTDDVVAAVQEAVSAGKRISVRSGGHCYENFVSNAETKVIIDVSGLDQVCWDETREAFCLGAGATNWRLYTHLYRPYGVTMPGGSCYSVGAGGHISAGGFGLLSRQFGLTVDYLHAVEVVIVDKNGNARAVIAERKDEDPHLRELCWAHTGGGGGNFGVITRYWMRDLPQPPQNVWLSGAQMSWDKMTKDTFTRLVRNYGTFFADHAKPGDPYADLFAILQLTHISKGALGLVVQLDATMEHGDLRLANFYDAVFAGINIDTVDIEHFTMQAGEHAPSLPLTLKGRTMPWIQATQTLNGSGENRRGKYKSAYHRTAFTDHHINTFYTYLSDRSYQAEDALLQIDSYGCAINKPGTDTAVAQRGSALKLQYQTYWTDQENDDLHLEWIRKFYAETYKHTGCVPKPSEHTDGCYIGYPDVDLNSSTWNQSGTPWSGLYYKQHYPRLQKVKAHWDPRDIFRHAQSIRLP
jgi:FAD/FMN-containing dehydrogenase